MQKRFSRFSRRTIVGAIVGVAFAAAAGVGLAQITSTPSTTVSALTTTIQSTGLQGDEDDFGDDSEANEDELEFEEADDEDESTSTGGQTTSTIGGATTGEQTTTSGDDGNGQEKVDVCHMTGSGKSHTIHIARPAVAAHVAHGDTEGACAQTTATTTTSRVKKPKHEHTSTHAGSTSHTSHGNSTHTSHGNSTHTSHGNSGHASHGSSGSSHGNGGGHGNGKGK